VCGTTNWLGYIDRLQRNVNKDAASPKFRYPPIRLYDVTIQRTKILPLIAVKLSKRSKHIAIYLSDRMVHSLDDGNYFIIIVVTGGTFLWVNTSGT
jgi:hypothetical protein